MDFPVLSSEPARLARVAIGRERSSCPSVLSPFNTRITQSVDGSWWADNPTSKGMTPGKECEVTTTLFILQKDN